MAKRRKMDPATPAGGGGAAPAPVPTAAELAALIAGVWARRGARMGALDPLLGQRGDSTMNTVAKAQLT